MRIYRRRRTPSSLAASSPNKCSRVGEEGVEQQLSLEFVVTLLPSEFEMNHFQSVYGEPRSSRGPRSSGCGRWSSRSKELEMVQEECLQRLQNWIEVPYDSIAKEQQIVASLLCLIVKVAHTSPWTLLEFSLYCSVVFPDLMFLKACSHCCSRQGTLMTTYRLNEHCKYV
ncbi:hypothetical protein TRIUR3_32884 [Triticum urartu]|uniref:Uncharacterized protein n=1 Tax=Triticum urartu TaxID=4572 RepID=M7ZS63_TRIUA|nr:hypothetical protein TRIUR3_32884 [Triticum urartu]